MWLILAIGLSEVCTEVHWPNLKLYGPGYISWLVLPCYTKAVHSIPGQVCVDDRSREKEKNLSKIPLRGIFP